MKKVILGTLLAIVALDAGAWQSVYTKQECRVPLCCADYRPASGFYVDGDIGLSNQQWRYSGLINNVDSPAVVLSHSLTNNPNGFTGGFDAGYKITQNIAGEFGAYFLPKVDAHWTLTEAGTSTTGTATISSWYSYAALKFMAPVFYNTDIFMKIGGAARSGEFRNDPAGIGSPGTPNMDVNSFNFLFGAGVQYYVNQTFSLNAQWIYLNGSTVIVPASSTPPASIPASISIPSLNSFVVGVGINLSNLFR